MKKGKKKKDQKAKSEQRKAKSEQRKAKSCFLKLNT
jgi:hypothetical protein